MTTNIRQLKPLDRVFLRLDGETQHPNIGVVSIYEPPPGASETFARDLFYHLRGHPAKSPFNERLVKPSRLKPYHWQLDEDFDIDNHVKLLQLPSPGHDQLFRLVASIHPERFDRSRPLWQWHLIEGLGDGDFAIYFKAHHVLFDGVRMRNIMLWSYNYDPDSEAKAPWQGLEFVNDHKRKRRSERQAKSAVDKVRGVLHTARELKGLMAALVAPPPGSDRAPSMLAPKSILNQAISADRGIFTLDYSMATLRAIGKPMGATVNDVFLALCGGALRRYLLLKQALPEESLRAVVPVDINHPDSGNNSITYITVELGTKLADAAQRLKSIYATISRAKAAFASVSPTTSLTMAIIGLGMTFVTNQLNPLGVTSAVNLLVSNISTSRSGETFYVGGAKMKAHYPLAHLLGDQTISITLISYREDVHVGIIYSPDHIRDVDELRSCFAASYDELLATVSDAASGDLVRESSDGARNTGEGEQVAAEILERELG